MEERIDNIISKMLSGNITDSERKDFNDWIESDKRNQEIFLKIQSYWNAKTQHTYPFSPENNFALLKEKINNNKRQVIYRKIKYGITAIASMAACILLIIVFSENSGKDASLCHEFKNLNKIDTLILPDQSVIVLNKNSSLSYSEDFNKKNRNIYLKGDAFFKVKSNKKLPFVIEMLSGNKITVLGTVFNVKSNTEKDNIVLLEGSIKFQTKKDQIILSPNQKIIFDKETSQTQILNLNPELSSFWLSGIYKYRSIALKELMPVLYEIYNINIKIESKELEDTNISGAFRNNQSIEEVLNALSTSLSLQWYYNDNYIVIKKE